MEAKVGFWKSRIKRALTLSNVDVSCENRMDSQEKQINGSTQSVILSTNDKN